MKKIFRLTQSIYNRVTHLKIAQALARKLQSKVWNTFLNNLQKQGTDSKRKEQIKGFKKRQRKKIFVFVDLIIFLNIIVNTYIHIRNKVRTFYLGTKKLKRKKVLYAAVFTTSIFTLIKMIDLLAGYM